MLDRLVGALPESPTALEIAAAVRERHTTAEAVMRDCLDRIARIDASLRAFVHVGGERALEAARTQDRSGEDWPLRGVPLAVKDTVDAAGLVCSWGTPIHACRVPDRDAEVVQALRRAGAIVVGTTHSTEYAIARSGPTRNPFDLGRTPGGSSSGSGAAVGAGLVPLAVATQTLGSIIRPSSYCGIYGLKPTHSSLPLGGMMPLCESFDHVGPMGRTVQDIAAAWLAMSGRHEPGFLEQTGQVDVLVVADPYGERMEPASIAAMARAEHALRDNGHSVRNLSLPSRFQRLEKVFKDIVFRGMALNHGADADAHPDLISENFAAIIAHGRAVTPEVTADAEAEADWMRGVILRLLRGNTVILSPATDGTAPAFGELTGSQMLQSLWSLSGAPALAVPTGFDDGLPVGVTLIAAPNRERFLLSVASGLNFPKG